MTRRETARRLVDGRLKSFRVGVFTDVGARGPRYRAYTTWYSPDWLNCQVVEVAARNGTEAKKLAIAQVRAARAADKAKGGEE